MRKPKFSLFLFFTPRLKILVWGCIIIILLGASFMLVNLIKILQTSDYFKVRDIIVSQDNRIDLSYLKDKNIFSIDLKRESGYIAKYYPAYRKIRLVRLLPNRLFVNFIKRKPTAIIKLYRELFVDEEQVIFDIPQERELEYSDLPLILGLETKIFGLKSGAQYNIKELTLALNIVKEVKSNRVLRDYTIKRINVANLSDASFYLLPKNQAATEIKALEVKFGADNMEGKFNVLTGLLTQDKNGLGNIEYIDLRFKEPVIKLKDVK